MKWGDPSIVRRSIGNDMVDWKPKLGIAVDPESQ